MLELKQSTAVTVKIGQFLDDTDGKTAETGLTITQSDVKLSKNGGTIASKNDSTSCTHDTIGIYGCPLDATDTNTLGRLQLWVHVSGALPVYHEFMVISASEYDRKYGSTLQQVNVTQWNGAAVSVGSTSSLPKVDAQAISDSTTAADNVETNISNLDASVSSRSSHSASDVWTATTRTLTAGTKDTEIDAIKAKTDKLNFNSDATPLILADVRDVNDNAVSSVNDFKADVSKLDVAVSTRSSHSASDVWSATTRTITGGTIDTNNDKTGYSISGTKTTLDDLNDISASDIWSAATRTLTAGTKDTEIDAIKAKTDKLNFNSDTTTLVLADIRDVNDTAVSSIDDFKASVDANAVADAVWDEAAADHTASGTFGAKNQKAVPSEDTADYKADVSSLPSSVWAYTSRTLTSGIPSLKKATALSNFEFMMYDSTDHVTPKTGLTITAQISKDGGSFVACSNAASEVGNGVYKISLTATETDADIFTLKFTATGADQMTYTFITST